MQKCPHCGNQEIPNEATVCFRCGSYKELFNSWFARLILFPIGFIVGLTVGGLLTAWLFQNGHNVAGGPMVFGSFFLALLVAYTLIELLSTKKTVWLHDRSYLGPYSSGGRA
jgi:hypothetical protein